MRPASPFIAPPAYPVLHRQTGPPRPVLRLSGLWLEQLGFAIGSKLQITARAGELGVSVVGAEAAEGRSDAP